jgi:hypothetical protein
VLNIRFLNEYRIFSRLIVFITDSQLTQLVQLLREAGIDPADIGHITQAFTAKVFRKSEYLLPEGTTCQHVGFVEVGLFIFFILAGWRVAKSK